jgi:uncharacterized membrane protein
MSEDVKYLISVGIFIFIISVICMIISYFRAKEQKESFLIYITRDRNMGFSSIMSMIGLIIMICVLSTLTVIFIHNSIF